MNIQTHHYQSKNIIFVKKSMLVKEKVLEAVQSLPAQFSIDELVEKLIILNKIEVGLQQVVEGKVLTTQEAKEQLKKWLK